MNFKLTHNMKTAVGLDIFWQRIDLDTPKGVKMLVIDERAGVAHISILRKEDRWTHWHALPRFKETT
jgi:hypothetical protein